MAPESVTRPFKCEFQEAAWLVELLRFQLDGKVDCYGMERDADGNAIFKRFRRADDGVKSDILIVQLLTSIV
jgi:hypothetical protein